MTVVLQWANRSCIEKLFIHHQIDEEDTLLEWKMTDYRNIYFTDIYHIAEVQNTNQKKKKDVIINNHKTLDVDTNDSNIEDTDFFCRQLKKEVLEVPEG